MSDHCSDCGRRFNRLANSRCHSKSVHIEPDKAQQIVEEIEKDLTHRRGFRQEFDQIDEDIRTEIRDTWANIIRKHLK